MSNSPSRFARIVSVSLALITAAGVSEAIELGPLTGIVEAERGEAWVISEARSGGALFENEQTPYDIRYYYLNPQPGDEGRREVSVDVEMIDYDPDSLAGILYGYRDNPTFYYVYAVTGEGSVVLFRRDAEGFHRQIELASDDIRQERTTLTIRENGNEISLLINGVEKSAIGNDLIGKGAVGIAAGHIGAYRFSNFKIDRPSNRASAEPKDALPHSTNEFLRLKPIEVTDLSAPSGPMVAFSTLVPNDWTTEGGIVWHPPGNCMKGPRTVWSARAPDKMHGVFFLPTFNWGWSNSQIRTGCVNARFDDPVQAVRYMLDSEPAITAEIIDVSRPPELQQLAAQATATFRSGLVAGTGHADAALIRVRASDGEVETESYLIAMTNHFEQASPDGWGGTFVSGGGDLSLLIALSAPVGKLDAGHPGITSIMANFRVNPAWNQEVLRWWARQRGQDLETFKAITRVQADASSSILGNISGTTSGSDDGHDRFISMIQGVDTYTTADGTASFTTDYNEVWRLDDGSYALTSEAGFNPLTATGQFGERLTPDR